MRNWCVAVGIAIGTIFGQAAINLCPHGNSQQPKASIVPPITLQCTFGSSKAR